MALNISPDYSAITINDKDAGITKITYSDIVEETPPNGHHKAVAFDFGQGPVTGYYVTSIQAEGAVIPDGSDVKVSYRRRGEEVIWCDTLRNVRQVRPGEYVCDWIYWGALRPFSEAPKLRSSIAIQGKTFELTRPIIFTGDRVCIEIVVGMPGVLSPDYAAIQKDLVPRSLSECRRIEVEAAALTEKGITQLVFVSQGIPLYSQNAEFVVRLEGVLPHNVEAVMTPQGDAA